MKLVLLLLCCALLGVTKASQFGDDLSSDSGAEDAALFEALLDGPPSTTARASTSRAISAAGTTTGKPYTKPAATKKPAAATKKPAPAPVCDADSIQRCNRRIGSQCNASDASIKWFTFALTLFVEDCVDSRDCLNDCCPRDISRVAVDLLDLNVWDARFEVTCAELLNQTDFKVGQYFRVSFRAECKRPVAEIASVKGGRATRFVPVVAPGTDACNDVRTRVEDLLRKVQSGTVTNYFYPAILKGQITDASYPDRREVKYVKLDKKKKKGGKKGKEAANKKGAKAPASTKAPATTKAPKATRKPKKSKLTAAQLRKVKRPGKYLSRRCLHGPVQPLNFYYASAHVNMTLRSNLKLYDFPCRHVVRDLQKQLNRLFRGRAPTFHITNYAQSSYVEKRVWVLFNCYDYRRLPDGQMPVTCSEALRNITNVLKTARFSHKLTNRGFGVDAVTYQVLAGPASNPEAVSTWAPRADPVVGVTNALFRAEFPIWGVPVVFLGIVGLFCATAFLLYVCACGKK